MTVKNEILIRMIQPGDVEDIFEIEKACFSRPWSRESLAAVVTDEKACYVVAVDKKTHHVVGYVGSYIILDEADINQVAVSEKYRRCGIAAALMQDFMQKLEKKNIKAITLEVRAGNVAAIALYKKMGFEMEGIRKNFYEAPVEDACIMWRR